MNEFLMFDKDLNARSMENWTEEETNFFLFIISKVRNTGTNIFGVRKNELKDLAIYSDGSLTEFIKILEELGKGICSFHYYEKTSDSLTYMKFFSSFKVNWNEDMSQFFIKIGVTENVDFIINKLDAEMSNYIHNDVTPKHSKIN